MEVVKQKWWSEYVELQQVKLNVPGLEMLNNNG